MRSLFGRVGSEAIGDAVIADVGVDLIRFAIVARILRRLCFIRSVHQNCGGELDVDITGVVFQDLFASLSARVYIAKLDLVIYRAKLLDVFPLISEFMTATTARSDEGNHPSIFIVIEHLVLV